MTIEHTLTNEELLAGLDGEQLRQLVGLVDYDADADPFPVQGWDSIGGGRGQCGADRAFLSVGLRHGVGGLLRSHHR